MKLNKSATETFRLLTGERGWYSELSRIMNLNSINGFQREETVLKTINVQFFVLRIIEFISVNQTVNLDFYSAILKIYHENVTKNARMN